jgi:hypothetical protein
MRYTICTVLPVPAGPDDSAGVFFPVPAAGTDAIVLEPGEDARLRRLRAREVSVSVAGGEPLLRADDIRAQVYVSDGRVAIACTRYDRGGGWIGGPIALVLNVVSRIRASRRSRGRMLVGHVRYPWLRGVYARNRSGLWGPELLRLFVVGEGVELQLDVRIARGESATDVATDIIRRAARLRLDHDEDATPSQRAELETLAALEPLRWSPGDELAGRDMPTVWPPTARSGRLGRAPAPDAVTVVRRLPAPASSAAAVSGAPDDVAVVLRERAADADEDLGVTLRRKPHGDDQP